MTNSILKSTFVILVTLLSFSISVAQNIKTYKGVFNKGKATYQYYENANLERVYHGHFLFTDSESRLEGEFKDNKKDGLWKYSSISNRYYQNESTLLSGRSLLRPTLPPKNLLRLDLHQYSPKHVGFVVLAEPNRAEALGFL